MPVITLRKPQHRLAAILTVIMLPVIIGGLAALIVTTCFTASASAPVKANPLCASASIQAMFGVQASELQQARATGATDTAIVLAQISDSVGARLTTCAGHLSATDASDLLTIQSEASQ